MVLGINLPKVEPNAEREFRMIHPILGACYIHQHSTTGSSERADSRADGRQGNAEM